MEALQLASDHTRLREWLDLISLAVDHELKHIKATTASTTDTAKRDSEYSQRSERNDHSNPTTGQCDSVTAGPARVASTVTLVAPSSETAAIRQPAPNTFAPEDQTVQTSPSPSTLTLGAQLTLIRNATGALDNHDYTSTRQTSPRRPMQVEHQPTQEPVALLPTAQAQHATQRLRMTTSMPAGAVAAVRHTTRTPSMNAPSTNRYAGATTRPTRTPA